MSPIRCGGLVNWLEQRFFCPVASVTITEFNDVVNVGHCGTLYPF